METRRCDSTRSRSRRRRSIERRRDRDRVRRLRERGVDREITQECVVIEPVTDDRHHRSLVTDLEVRAMDAVDFADAIAAPLAPASVARAVVWAAAAVARKLR